MCEEVTPLYTAVNGTGKQHLQIPFDSETNSDIIQFINLI